MSPACTNPDATVAQPVLVLFLPPGADSMSSWNVGGSPTRNRGLLEGAGRDVPLDLS